MRCGVTFILRLEVNDTMSRLNESIYFFSGPLPHCFIASTILWSQRSKAIIETWT